MFYVSGAWDVGAEKDDQTPRFEAGCPVSDHKDGCHLAVAILFFLQPAGGSDGRGACPLVQPDTAQYIFRWPKCNT